MTPSASPGEPRSMKFAYADPPYFGYAGFYDHPDAAKWDTLDAHRDLLRTLARDYPDGWAVSLTTGNLFDILPLCEVRPRIAAWVKPFASFKPGVNPAYCWEPVLFMGGRKRTADDLTVRDWHSANITLRRGLTGAKPESFCRWIAQLLGATDMDVIDDLFPGTHAFGNARAQLTAMP